MHVHAASVYPSSCGWLRNCSADCMTSKTYFNVWSTVNGIPLGQGRFTLLAILQYGQPLGLQHEISPRAQCNFA